MKPAAAYAVLLGLVAATFAAFAAPWPVLVVWFAATLLLVKSGRWSLLAFAALTVAFDALLLAWAAPGPTVATWGPIALGSDGAMDGAVGGLRLSVLIATNWLALARWPPALFVDALRLPPRPTALLAALLISTQDVGRDARRMVRIHARGKGRFQRARQVAAVLPNVLALAMHRAAIRRDALTLAGIHAPRGLVPVVALASVAIAGRLALVAVPNVALTFVVIFAGGLVFGPWIAALAAVVAMTVSNVLISGLVPTSFVNVPAMALVGLLGGVLRGLDLEGDHPWAGRVTVAAIGFLATMAFSVTADATEWLLVPEFRASQAFLGARIAAGVAFNLFPAILNAVLFAAVVVPTQRAFRAPIQSTHQQ